MHILLTIPTSRPGGAPLTVVRGFDELLLGLGPHKDSDAAGPRGLGHRDVAAVSGVVLALLQTHREALLLPVDGSREPWSLACLGNPEPCPFSPRLTWPRDWP